MKKIKCIPAVLLALGLIGFSTSGYSQSHTSGETTPVRVGSTILNLGIGVGADYRHSSSLHLQIRSGRAKQADILIRELLNYIQQPR